MTTNVTSPALYALGTVTTAVSFVVIALALGSIALIQRRSAPELNALPVATQQPRGSRDERRRP